MKRIRVPEGVIEAGVSAVRSYCAAHGYVGDDGHISDAWLGAVPEVVGAALLHLSEHPQVPTDEQLQAMREHLLPDMPKGAEHFTSNDLFMGAVEWQRRCFVQEEPEIPAELKDLLFVGGIASGSDCLSEVRRDYLDERIVEAYRRGMRKGDQK